jgi:sigma-B regulation protein RsbU (phosphoserine phosphatase)
MFMFSSLKSKIIFFVTLVMVATAAAIMYFTHKDVGYALSRAEEASAKNVLRLVDLNIQGGYQKLLSDRIDAMVKRKATLQSQARLAVSVLEQHVLLRAEGLFSEKKAQEMGLNWFRSLFTEKEELFVFDKNGVVLAHPDSAVGFMSLAVFRDMKGRCISEAMCEPSLEPCGDFAVFEWMKPGEKKGSKKLAYFVPFPWWHWTVAAMVDISDIEAEARKKLDEIVDVLRETFANIRIGETGSLFLFNGKKEVLIPPHGDGGSDYGTLRNARTGNLLLDDLMRAAKSDNNALSYEVPRNRASRLMEAYIRYFKSLDWYVAVGVPVREIKLPAKKLVTQQSYIIAMIFIGSLIVAYILVTRISRPLNLLASYARELPTTDFTAEDKESSPIEALPAKFRDEVGRLAESFVFMKAELRKNIKNLMETTAAKERIESELQIAHDIQMGILPKVFPPYPDRTEFEIYATLEAAKEVGGDLYDFFFMDDDHLCFTIGDVSGKGVPAALFMAITKTLVHMKATKGLMVEDILKRVNEDLSVDNPSFMFVTLFLGILDVRTGEMVYCNGGHNPPFHIRRKGDVVPLAPTHGMALGVMKGFSYHSNKIVLEAGDTLFLYTDGITEARNEKREMFSDSGLRNELLALKDLPTHHIVTGILDRVRTFSEGIPQNDDITMLAIRYKGTGE